MLVSLQAERKKMFVNMPEDLDAQKQPLKGKSEQLGCQANDDPKT